MSSSIPNNVESSDAGDPQAVKPGRLKVFLGYAAGVGKTYHMLEEAQQMMQQGDDIVVGYFEPHGRKDTIAKVTGLEMVPRRKLMYRGTAFEEMDTPAILERRPRICIVDELAHSNIPGAGRAKRWEDVQILLDAGIDVLTTVNIQHLESLNDQIFQISGVRVRETVPDWFVRGADEIVMIDATTGALLNRLKRGDIYARDKAQKAMENFFKEETLTALRELALRQTAHELDVREHEKHHPAPHGTQTEAESVAAAGAREAETRDRILICVTSDASSAMLIRRGRRMADYLGADCFAVYAGPKQKLEGLPKEEREAIEKHMKFAHNLRIETQILEGKDPAQTVVDFAQRNRITQIIVARPRTNRWMQILKSDRTLQIVRDAKDVRVIVVAERRPR
jgi:two-component system sensor histidine kinase KdpD